MHQGVVLHKPTVQAGSLWDVQTVENCDWSTWDALNFPDWIMFVDSKDNMEQAKVRPVI